VDELHDDRDLDLARFRTAFDSLDLMVVAVHERDPRAAVFGVASLRLVEDLFDHGAGVVDDAGGQPLVGSDRSRDRVMFGVLVAGDDVGWGARDGGRVIHRADLGHPLVVALLGAREPGLGMFRPLPGSREGGFGAQRVGAHHDPFPFGCDHQQIPTLRPGWLARLVEVLEVDRGDLGELLDLAFGELLPSRPLDPADGVLEAPARRF
jgi:hypothetical protein